ncbi:hypothetical protein [Streptomyces bungoensis]|uniref:hypothetical protein n=1 Tax=Streptomyces bungoensis TaxID=285568 RepID=UPI00340C5541
MSTAPRRPPRHRAWPRLLVLLLALLVPGAHVQAQAAPVPAFAAGAAEHEHEVPGAVAWPAVHAAPPRGPAPAPRAPARPGARASGRAPVSRSAAAAACRAAAAHGGPALLTAARFRTAQSVPERKEHTAMPSDPYAVLRALLRAEARRGATQEPENRKPEQQRPEQERDR